MKTDCIPEREIHWWKRQMPKLLRISPCLCNLLVCWVFPSFGVQEIKYYGRICHSQLITRSLWCRISQCYFYYFIHLAWFFFLVILTMYGRKFNKEKHLKLVILYIKMLLHSEFSWALKPIHCCPFHQPLILDICCIFFSLLLLQYLPTFPTF